MFTPILKWNAGQKRQPKGSPKGGEFAGTSITSSYDGYQHTLTLKDAAGKELGSAKLRINPRDIVGGKLAEYDILYIDPKARGKGYGEHLYRAVANKAKELGAKQILGDVTSAGVLRLGIKVLGKPEYIADAIREYSLDEAMKQLSPLAPENAEGIIDTGNYLAVRWPLTKRKY